MQRQNTIRNHILQTFEKVIAAPKEDRESLLNLTIVGAGPTGVELAGAFAEIKREILPKDYHDIDLLESLNKITPNNKENTLLS